MNTAEGTLAEQSVGMRGAGTSGREILCKLTLSQEGTCFDTVLKILLLIILALMPLVVIIFWLLHFQNQTSLHWQMNLATSSSLGNV